MQKNNVMRKTICQTALAALMAFAATSGAWAIKATPRPVAVRQPDGSTLMVRIHGDENFHYVTTTDGFLVQRDNDGFFKYVTAGNGNSRAISGQRANSVGQRESEEMTFVSKLTPLRSREAVDKMFPQAKNVKAKAPEQVLNLSKVKARQVRRVGKVGEESQYLVILVRYSDDVLHYGVSDFERWLNEPGYAVDGGTGSVKDYYRDNSMGQFVPNFTVLGPYTLDHEETYYAANDTESSDDVNPQAMIIEAVTKAKADHPELDFSQFDNDGDGYMDNVNVIYSGYGEAASGDTHDMWPHSYRLSASDQQFQVDGITVNNYSVSAELIGGSGAKMDGIGTFTHEFGHVLGLKDMYDTDDYTDGLGTNPGDYSIYASGSYNNDSRTPPYLMAFERQQMGWLTLTPLDKAEDVELQPIYTNAARYIDAQPNLDWDTQGGDWYVLENRQQTGWDKYIPAHGLLIYHYDYTAESVEEYWSVNGPNNNAQHRCLYIIPADGTDDDLTRKGDTYPGTTGSTEFTDESHPKATSWTGEKLHTPITNITEEADGIVRFQVKGGSGTLSFIRTVTPTDADISDSTITVGAQVVEKKSAITEMGFCWSDSQQYPTTADNKAVVETADKLTYTITGLKAATTYYVRAYMTLADSSTIYGAAVPVKTEHEVIQAPYAFMFNQWDGEEPVGWRIIDNNGDGMTWVQDSSTEAIVYQFDYWNNADDWLISEKMHIPERGTLYIVRGVTDEAYVEKLDVYVSTRSRSIDDFHLVQSLTLADHFGEQTVDEVDLSDYADEDVYVALVAKSDRMQNAIWLWEVLLTNRLETPTITTFNAKGNALHLEWTPVDGAKYYYLAFSEVTDSVNTTVTYLPENDMTTATGNVEVGTGLLKFIQSGTVETKAYPDSIKAVQFMQYVSGPRGSSTLSVEGSADGVTWERIGELQRLTANDSEGTAVDLTSYMSGKYYNRLRVTCEYGGRLVTLRNFTITYNDGYVLNSLAEGSVYGTSIDINETTKDEFFQGKKYAAEVYAGDGLLFYDASPTAYYQSASSGIADITSSNGTFTKVARTICRDGMVRMSGLKAGSTVSLYSIDGRLLRRFVATGTTAAVTVDGYRGIVIGKQN